MLKIVNKFEWNFSNFLKKRKKSRKWKSWTFFVTCRNISSILVEVITKTIEKIDDTSCTIAFFCCFETILKNSFHEKFSEFTFFEAKWIKYFSEIVKRFSLKEIFRFFSVRENFSVNTWKLSTFKYVRKIKELRYFSDNWNKILIVLAIKNPFTIQLLKYDSEFCFFWTAFFLIFFFSIRLLDSEKNESEYEKIIFFINDWKLDLKCLKCSLILKNLCNW